jgi:phosphohistidine swiveling domain-containing protein
MREEYSDPSIIVTNIAGGSAVATMIQRAKAIVSTVGGPNSHIVVVARDHGIPCIVGASELDLSALAEGAKVRLRTNGDIEIQLDEGLAPSEIQLRLLRKIAFAGVVRVPADIIGFAHDLLASTLQELAASGLVRNDGLILLTATGASHLEAAYAKDRQRLRDTDRAGLLTDFRPLDRELKHIARRWQDAETANNAAEKLATVEELSRLHEGTREFISRYRKSLPRLDEYRERLESAHRLVKAGSTEYLVSSKLDSYHIIWSHFHEDLLRILQRTRDPE